MGLGPKIRRSRPPGRVNGFRAKWGEVRRCHIATTMHAKRALRARGPTGSQSQAVGAPTATIQAVVFRTMLALTPSIGVVAILLLRERTGPSDDEESDFRDLSSSQKIRI